MKILIGTLAVALTLALPAAAEVKATAQGKDKAVAAKTMKRVVTRQIVQPWNPGQPPYSIYAHHPSYDVYVRGNYVGSDPDWRIRSTLRQEYCADQWDGC